MVTLNPVIIKIIAENEMLHLLLESIVGIRLATEAAGMDWTNPDLDLCYVELILINGDRCQLTVNSVPQIVRDKFDFQYGAKEDPWAMVG